MKTTEEEKEEGDPFEAEALRLTRLLGIVIKVTGKTFRGLEQELGLGRGSLSRVLNGSRELRLRQLLMILGAVQLEPEEFFRMAYPRRRPAGGKGAPLLDDLETALGSGPGFEPEPDAASDERTRRSLIRLLELGPDAEPETP